MALIIVLPRSNGNINCGYDIIINNINSNSKIIINNNFVYNLTNNETIKLSNLYSAVLRIGINTEKETKYFIISEEKHFFYTIFNKHKIKINIDNNNIYVPISKFSTLIIKIIADGM